MRYPLLVISCLSFLIFNVNLSATDDAATNCYNDNIPPVAVCDEHTVVALGADGLATLYAYNLDDGSYDNCAIAYFKAARMWPGWCPDGVVDDTQFRPYVQFCCEDVGASPIWIIMRVYDTSGNYNQCMVQVDVQNGPSSLHCPPDKTIYCDYWFDWNDLYDPWNSFFGWPTSGGGCNNPNVSVQVYDHRTCGVGSIERVFTIDGGYGGGWGWDNSCTQHIWVEPHYPFNGEYINWPPYYTANGCDMVNVDPQNLPYPYDRPHWTDTPCSLVGYSWDDQVFEFVDGVCKKILRTWTVIDWCKYDPHHPYYGGIWTYLQVIKLVDHSKPQFENCKDMTVDGLENDCKGRFIFHPQVWDECTPLDKLSYEYKIDLYANGTYDIMRKGVPYIDEVLPLGHHKVYWFIDDNCGNLNSCSFYIDVRDKKPPTPVCYAALSTVVMPQGGMITLWAKDFDASSFDNCTKREKLRFSFSPNVLETSHVFTCDDVGVVSLPIYATDEAGNQAYCTVSITITDNGPVCPDMNPLTGTVTMFTGEAVSGADVALYKIMPDGSELMDMTKQSADDGSYKVGFGTTQYDRMLEVTKQTNSMAGISTLDLVYLQQHILGITPITHPAALRAADVDGSGHVGVNDLLMLRDAFLSGGRSLNGTALPWEFYPSDCDWLPNGQPACQFNVEIDHTAPPSYPLDFIGYKVGDINGDIMQDPANRSAYHFPIGVRYDKTQKAFVFVAMDDADILGMQLSLKAALTGGPKAMIGGALNMTEQNCYLDQDRQVVNMSWITPSVEPIRTGEVLFTMPAPDNQASRSQALWGKGLYRNEMYLADKTPVPVEIKILDAQQSADLQAAAAENGVQQSDQSIGLRSGDGTGAHAEEAFFAPNPMSEAGLLYFRLLEDQDVQLEIFSASQQLIVAKKVAGARGMNQVLITSDDLGQTGVFLYRLTAGEKSFTGRIICVN